MPTCQCGSASGVHLYPAGYRCARCSPAAIAGHPEPGAGRYCPPAACYCGSCPAWTRRLIPASTPTIIDIRAITSGKRRSSLEDYRAAQATVRQLRGEQP